MPGRPVRDIQQAINFQQPEQAPYLRRSHHYPQFRSTGGGTLVGLHDGARPRSRRTWWHSDAERASRQAPPRTAEVDGSAGEPVTITFTAPVMPGRSSRPSPPTTSASAARTNLVIIFNRQVRCVTKGLFRTTVDRDDGVVAEPFAERRDPRKLDDREKRRVGQAQRTRDWAGLHASERSGYRRGTESTSTDDRTRAAGNPCRPARHVQPPDRPAWRNQRRYGHVTDIASRRSRRAVSHCWFRRQTSGKGALRSDWRQG
jgi:hypothetical protein